MRQYRVDTVFLRQIFGQMLELLENCFKSRFRCGCLFFATRRVVQRKTRIQRPNLQTVHVRKCRFLLHALAVDANLRMTRRRLDFKTVVLEVNDRMRRFNSRTTAYNVVVV